MANGKAKYNIRLQVPTTGICVDNADVSGYLSFKLVTENAGPTNLLRVFGKLIGETDYNLIGSLTGENEKVFDVKHYDLLRIECVTLDTPNNYLILVASGFYALQAGTEVTILNDVLDVHIVGAANTTTVNAFDKVESLPSGIETAIVSYRIPLAVTGTLQKVEFSGQNIATFKLYVNGTQIAEKNTWFSGPLFGDFNFAGSMDEGLVYEPNDLIELKVIHERTLGDFSGRIQVLLKE